MWKGKTSKARNLRTVPLAGPMEGTRDEEGGLRRNSHPGQSTPAFPRGKGFRMQSGTRVSHVTMTKGHGKTRKPQSPSTRVAVGLGLGLPFAGDPGASG